MNLSVSNIYVLARPHHVVVISRLNNLHKLLHEYKSEFTQGASENNLWLKTILTQIIARHKDKSVVHVLFGGGLAFPRVYATNHSFGVPTMLSKAQIDIALAQDGKIDNSLYPEYTVEISREITLLKANGYKVSSIPRTKISRIDIQLVKWFAHPEIVLKFAGPLGEMTHTTQYQWGSFLRESALAHQKGSAVFVEPTPGGYVWVNKRDGDISAVGIYRKDSKYHKEVVKSENMLSSLLSESAKLLIFSLGSHLDMHDSVLKSFSDRLHYLDVNTQFCMDIVKKL